MNNYYMTTDMSPVTVVMSLIIMVLMIIAMWKIFTKAGEPGWKSIIRDRFKVCVNSKN